MNKHRNGIKQALVVRAQRPRASRHNTEHKRRATYTEMENVPAGTPGATRSIETDEKTGELTVVHKARVTKQKWVPVTEGFPRRVAADSTTAGWQENKLEHMAPKGKGGAKPLPGGKE